MHLTDLESRCIAAAWHAVVGRALRNAPCLLHVVHLEVTERDVPCVAEAATYNMSDVSTLVLFARDKATHLHHWVDTQC